MDVAEKILFRDIPQNSGEESVKPEFQNGKFGLQFAHPKVLAKQAIFEARLLVNGHRELIVIAVTVD